VWIGRWWRGCTQASDRLSASLGDGQGHLDRKAQQEIGRAIIVDLLQAEAQERLSAGLGAWSMLEQDSVAKAVFDALFGLGRLQPLVDDDRIENIIITGHDTVRLELTDGTIISGEPVADSDSELIEFLVFLASRSEVNARPFSAAQPRLHLRLDGGAPARRGGLGDLAALGGDPAAPAPTGQPE
jgi:pilus assembly protein CpaF